MNKKELEALADSSGRMSRGPDVQNVYPVFSISSLPDLHPDAIGANVNGLYYTRAQYEILRSSCRAVGPKWSQDWPTEPGWYWFYGYSYRQYADMRPPTSEDQRLIMVQVFVSRGIALCWGEGELLHRMIKKPANGGAVGVWQRAEAPKLPTP